MLDPHLGQQCRHVEVLELGAIVRLDTEWLAKDGTEFTQTGSDRVTCLVRYGIEPYKPRTQVNNDQDIVPAVRGCLHLCQIHGQAIHR
ncbi:MAG: hypothetical protein AN485_22950 [Anabaena sp. MDT14b]|nr:MAG: hypothetical protein AN485_22950 [Anabaena sp. MDT14b]